ncbi:MAG: glycosyltransferase, partial [Methylococcales bacterium]
YGNNAKSIMLKKDFNIQELDVIYNSLDYSTQSELRESIGIEERNKIRDEYSFDRDGVVLIAIGRLMGKLKIEQAIQALSMANMNQNTYLIVVGDGPEKDNLTHLASDLGIKDKVIFYGECHDEKELSLLYNASDVSVVMGKVGLSAMHSLAYGVPMITNNSMHKHFPEIEAIIENKTGWYFKEDDIEDFVSKLHKIEYKGNIYQNCIQTIEDHYTPDKQVYFIEQAISKHLHL